MNENDIAQHPFRFGRFFALSSFVVLLLSAVVLVYFYRVVAIESITDLGTRNNLTLTDALLRSVRDPLADYVVSVNGLQAGDRPRETIPQDVQTAISELMTMAGVVRVKLYNRNGIVVYSTKSSQTGDDKSDNPGFISALGGQHQVKLVYRDTFNVFDEETEEDNLVQTYVPLRRGPGLPVIGVFELYTDANQLADRVTIAELKIGAGAIVILLCVYGALLLIVRYAERIIDRQQNVIRERSHALEVLSSQLVSNQEAEKRIIAWELHEGVTQALVSVKFHLDAALQAMHGDDRDRGLQAVERAIPVVVEAIEEVRAKAMDLRPSSLDDFGVVKTLEWLLPRFRAQYPEIDLAFVVEVTEREVREELKIVIYRLVQEVLNRFVNHPGARGMVVSLGTDSRGLVLSFALRGANIAVDEDDGRLRPVKGTGLNLIKERAYLSGGSFKLRGAGDGEVIAELTWAA